MQSGKGIRLVILGAALVPALLCSCHSAPPPRLDPANLALLRLEYLERSAELPNVNLASVELPSVDRIGRFSPLVWRIRSEQAPGRELYRPLPVGDIDLYLYQTLARVLEDFGFNVRGWTEAPALSLRVEVQNLVLLTEDGSQGRRACEMTLLFHIVEHPSGLEIETFRSEGRCELPGSWTLLRGEEAIWLPRGSEGDPIVLATEAVAVRFLQESLEFWKTPAHWEKGRITFWDSNRP